MFAASKTAGAVSAEVNYIEDVFSTYLYTGNFDQLIIENGIDLLGKGGMVWTKSRTNSATTARNNHFIIDSARGWTGSTGQYLNSNTTAAQSATEVAFVDPLANGYQLGQARYANDLSLTYASWTFRKQPKFFDVVTWSGTGISVAHSLGTTPATIILKRTNAVDDWYVVHRSANGFFSLNTTNAASGTSNAGIGTDTNTAWVAATSTTCNFENFGNAAGTYVAYLFAHNAGGFGLTGTDNVISCGSFTTNGSGVASVTLDYEPQFVLVKRTDSTSDWFMMDNMRGLTADPNNPVAMLRANLSNAENTASYTGWSINATGFGWSAGAASATYIYIAIRRGPMKVPTSGTSVFSPAIRTGTGSSVSLTSAGFPPDLYLPRRRNTSSGSNYWWDRLRGSSVYLASDNTNAEVSGTRLTSFNQTGVTLGSLDPNASGSSYVDWYLRRAPSFFDEVCYTGNGVADRVINHNLTVAPELMIVKKRSSATQSDWVTQTSANSFASAGYLQTTDSFGYSASLYSPTATTFTASGDNRDNASGSTYVAYLFATCAGVSKVGSYTGNGTTQTINCGFTGGARFVLIKRTDSTGDWYVYDTARGMTTLTDPYLLLNSTAAESATLGSVTTVSTGFALNASILAAINTNGASYIFLAIA